MAASIVPFFNCSSKFLVIFSSISKEKFESSFFSRGIISGSKYGAIEYIKPNLNGALKSFLLITANSLIFSASSKTIIACLSIFSPITVMETSVRFLSKIKTPNSFSIFFIAKLKAGWLTKLISAALRKFFSCATETINLSSLKVMLNFIYQYYLLQVHYSL